MITENEDKVEEALEALLAALREEVKEEGRVSIEVHHKLQQSYAEVADRLREKEQQVEEFERRNAGMLSHLTRIRTKADMASGFTHGSLEDCALQGRAAGAEGAVDRLIALYAGKLKEEQDNLPTSEDGTHRLCVKLYGECGPKQMRYILGGSDAKMLHDAVEEITRLENLLMAAQVPEWVIKGEDSGLDG